MYYTPRSVRVEPMAATVAGLDVGALDVGALRCGSVRCGAMRRAGGATVGSDGAAAVVGTAEATVTAT